MKILTDFNNSSLISFMFKENTVSFWYNHSNKIGNVNTNIDRLIEGLTNWLIDSKNEKE